MEIGRARSEEIQCNPTPPVERKVLDLLIGDQMPHRARYGIDQAHGSLDVNALGRCTQREFDIDRGSLFHFRLHVLRDHRVKAGPLHGNAVTPDRQIADEVTPGLSSVRTYLNIGGIVSCRDLGAHHHRAAGVGYDAGNAGPANLGPQRNRGQSGQKQKHCPGKHEIR